MKIVNILAEDIFHPVYDSVIVKGWNVAIWKSEKGPVLLQRNLHFKLHNTESLRNVKSKKKKENVI